MLQQKKPWKKTTGKAERYVRAIVYPCYLKSHKVELTFSWSFNYQWVSIPYIFLFPKYKLPENID